MESFTVLGILCIYVRYLFTTATGHVVALYAPFTATAVAAGALPMMVAIYFGTFGNLMWGSTGYDGGPGPIYFAQGYFEQPRFYKINPCVATANMIIIFIVDMLWWKLLGYY